MIVAVAPEIVAVAPVIVAVGSMMGCLGMVFRADQGSVFDICLNYVLARGGL